MGCGSHCTFKGTELADSYGMYFVLKPPGARKRFVVVTATAAILWQGGDRMGY